MIVKFHEVAPPGMLFAPNAFDYNIGRTIPLKIKEGSDITMEIMAVKVIEEGRAAEISGWISRDIDPLMGIGASYRIEESHIIAKDEA